MSLTPELVADCRSQFPALARQVAGQPAVFFDGPAGTQVPQRVIEAVSRSLGWTNANHGGLFPTSQESDALLDEAHRAAADLLGADDPECVVFGQNMTSLTFAFSRALARTWSPGDEIVVTQLDHDANVTPWVLAARDTGALIRYARFDHRDGTLDIGHLREQLSPRTQLVAVGCASNSTGSINPVAEITKAAHEVGALVFLDAVHFAPHQLIDVAAWNCDFLACSAYKFFGPHIGILWGRRRLLEELAAYKVRPAPNTLPGKWMTGTQSHESICGAREAIDYLADLGRAVACDRGLSRREALVVAYQNIGEHERRLAARMLTGLADIPGVTIRGIADPGRVDQRVATISITHPRHTSADLATRLGERGIFVWHGNYYALQITEQLGLEPDGMLRIGLVHYNTEEEVDRFLAELAGLV